MRLVAAFLILLLALPAAAQNKPASGNAAGAANTNCADTGNNANQAMAKNAQPCTNGSQNSIGRDTSINGNQGQKRHPTRQ